MGVWSRMAAALQGVTGKEIVSTCDLCGGAGQRRFRVVDGREILRCLSCGLLYMRERIPDEALSAIYSESYYRERGMVRDDPALERSSNRERLEWLPPLKAGQHGRLLDVGCGIGSFLADARDEGWEIVGTEVSAWSVGIAREHFGVEIVQGSVQELLGAHWQPGTFDVVTCWHNIEHQRHPMLALKAMRDLLKPGGRLVLRTPNAASFDQWWYGESWVGWHDPGHFYFFGLRQMERYCAAVGLRVLHVDRGTTRALEGFKVSLRRLRGKPPADGGGSVPDRPSRKPEPQPNGPAGQPGLKRTLLRLASRVASGRDMTLLAERP